MKSRIGWLAAIAVWLGIGVTAFAADWPTPLDADLVPPLKHHVQRFLDSSNQLGEKQCCPVRTYRAPAPFKYNPANDYIYGVIGNGLVAYRPDTLVTGGLPLSRITRAGEDAELYLSWAARYDKDASGSGWSGFQDGQLFLRDFDFDDRGILYIGYSVFGWGLVSHNGSGMKLEWYQNGATNPAELCSGNCPDSTAIVSFRSGGSYFALVGSGASWGVWNVDNVKSPRFIGSIGVFSGASRNADGTLLTFADLSGTVKLVSGAKVAQGSLLGATNVTLGGQILAAGAFDGSSFWFVPISGTSSFYKVSATGGVTAYPMGESLPKFGGVFAGEGYLFVMGGLPPLFDRMRTYAIEPSGLQEIPALGAFLTDFYSLPKMPDRGVLPYKHTNGKTYFVLSSMAMGDVYEIEAGDSLRIDWSAANAPSPFYGDPITFRVTHSGTNPPTNVVWNLGDGTTTTRARGDQFIHRYTSQPGTITVTASSNPEMSDAETITLRNPSARVLTPDGLSVTTTPASPLGPYVRNLTLSNPGADAFSDSSDGVTAERTAAWTLDNAPETTGPKSPVGECGVRTLSFEARYAAGFTRAVSIPYTVAPVVAAANTKPVGDLDVNVTFENLTELDAGAFGAGVWTEEWVLLDAGGSPVRDLGGNPYAWNEKSTTAAIGTLSDFDVPRALIPTNGKIRLTITVATDDISATSCKPSGATLTTVDEIPLTTPDPKIVRTLCGSPTTASGSCTLSVRSESSASKSGWTYKWYLNSSLAATTETYTPSFPTAGQYTVRVVATNTLKLSGEDSTVPPLDVLTPPCSEPGDVYFSWNDSGLTLHFTARATSPYLFQSCDSFSWSFGDGTSGTGQSPTHTYSQAKTYTVKLTVTNDSGTSTFSRSVTVGTVAPPPPPPPPNPGTCEDPRGKVSPLYVGSQSGCAPFFGKPPCNVGESVQFSVGTNDFSLATCHTVSWQFGSGASPATSTSRTPAVSYTSVGSRSVTMTVSNGSVSATSHVDLTTQTSSCGVTAPSGLEIEYEGQDSGCGPGNSILCEVGEPFKFWIKSGGPYAVLGCESFAWDFGGTGTSNLKNPANHTFPGVGPYNVAVTVTNTHGSGSGSRQVMFNDPSVPKPVVTVTPVSTKAKVGSEIFFLGNAETDPDHPVLALDWRVIRMTGGDTVIRTESNQGGITHTFNDVGDYRVEFTATNAGGVSDPAVALVNVALIQEYSFLIPVVAHLPGSNGTKWRTDLQIFNTDPLKTPIEFEFEFRGGLAEHTKTITMTSSTVIYEDFLAVLSDPFPSLEDAGPVVVRARGDSPPQMWSRTYTVDDSGIGSYGQFIPAVPLDSSLQSEGQIVTYVLPGLEISERFRTNLGIVNPSTQPVSVNVMARDDSQFGFLIGSFDVQVPPLALVQIGDLLDRIDEIELGKPFSLNLQTFGDAPLVVYGSMIDQLSNDPVYINGIRDIDQEGEGRKVQILPGTGHFEQANGTWRSDVVIYNPDLQAIHFDLTYFDGSGTKVAEARNQPLGVSGFVRIEDVLKWPSLDKDPGNSLGLIKVETQESVNRYPIVFARTYKDRGEIGSFGQGIPAISPEDANVKVGQPAFLAGVRSDESFYTNLGLVAVGDSPSVVKVTLLHDGSGTPVGTWQYVIGGEVAGINPNASLIVTNIIRAISPLANRGTLKIEVMSGGDLWAYASVIAASDPTCQGCAKPEHTFDPEYIPAVPMPLY